MFIFLNILMRSTLLINKIKFCREVRKKPPIYNYTVPRHTGLDFDKFSSSVRDIGSTMPSLKTFWYYSSMTTTDPRIFKILNLLFHIFPAYILDLWLYINKKKTK
jgi:hypothetical protein